MLGGPQVSHGTGTVGRDHTVEIEGASPDLVRFVSFPLSHPDKMMQNSAILLQNGGIWPGPGLGPSPGWGPYGPIWALMLVFKSEAFRVQTAPFDKIRIEFRRSPEASTHPRPSGSQKTKA